MNRGADLILFGLAVAILIDATIARSILAPASMVLLGDRNWYLPKWLSWLSHVIIEGHVPPMPSAAPAFVATSTSGDDEPRGFGPRAPILERGVDSYSNQ